MKKINWKYRILYAILIGILYTGLLYIFSCSINDITFPSKGLIIQGVFFGIFFGFGFPFLMEKIAPILIEKVKRPIMNDNEKILFEDGSNMFNGKIISVGGKLFLTNKRLIFNSHKYNFQKGAL